MARAKLAEEIRVGYCARVPLDGDQGNPVARRRAQPGVKSLAAAALLLAACGPRVRPAMLEPEPEPEPRSTKVAPVAPGRGVLVGEMCPEGAAGRPAVAPLLVRGVGWSSDPDDVETQLERSARAFAVLGVDGKRAGIFEVLGAADAGLAVDVAIGGYVGRPPCAPASTTGGAEPDPACVKATRGCGLAVASIDRGADPEAPDLAAAGACISGDALIVDIDGDGAGESFPVAQFVDPVRAPAEEVTASPVIGPSCEPTATIYGHVVVPADEPGDKRYHVTLDVLGVVDLDGDGRRELAIAFRYPEGRTFTVYSALRQAGRLELVGEAPSWP